MTTVKINLAALEQKFHPCTPEFIKNVCQARCCRSSTDPSGIAVVVTKSEAITLRVLGAEVDSDSGRVAPINRRCPFQSGETHLCSLHNSSAKPRGCIISPFTINLNRTLIVRNRYRLLPCFKAEGAIPVNQAHRGSLVALFGERQVENLEEKIKEKREKSINLTISEELERVLLHKNQASRAKL